MYSVDDAEYIKYTQAIVVLVVLMADSETISISINIINYTNLNTRKTNTHANTLKHTVIQ